MLLVLLDLGVEASVAVLLVGESAQETNDSRATTIVCDHHSTIPFLPPHNPIQASFSSSCAAGRHGAGPGLGGGGGIALCLWGRRPFFASSRSQDLYGFGPSRNHHTHHHSTLAIHTGLVAYLGGLGDVAVALPLRLLVCAAASNHCLHSLLAASQDSTHTQHGLALAPLTALLPYSQNLLLVGADWICWRWPLCARHERSGPLFDLTPPSSSPTSMMLAAAPRALLPQTAGFHTATINPSIQNP